MGRVHREVVGQGEQPLPDGAVRRPGQRLGLLRGEQVRTGHPADHQRAAGEHGDRPPAVPQHERLVLGRVAGRRDDLQHEPAEVDLLAVLQRAVVEGQAAAGGREQPGAPGGELAATRHEVGVQVRLDDEPCGQAPAVELAHDRPRVPGGVDDERAAVAQVDHVGGVAQPGVLERGDGHGGALSTRDAVQVDV